MDDWIGFIGSHPQAVTAAVGGIGVPVVRSFGRPDAEYAAVGDGAGVVHRSDRGLLEMTGSERASWLHNITTNQVKTLARGDGNYAFALNVQGRILFDLNILVREESIWTDIDKRFLEFAKAHFDKYIITEDVSITDRTDEFVRLGLVGERAKVLLTELGISHAVAMPTLGVTETSVYGADVVLVRHDVCGSFGVETYVPIASAVRVWQTLTDSTHAEAATPVGYDAVQVRRIESGIPWPGHEITNDALPAETHQLSRAVNFNKGCYLGQEVVERMRSRDVAARGLVGLQIDGDTVVPENAELLADDGKPAGKVTSSCMSPAMSSVIGLAYVKTKYCEPGSSLRVVWDDAMAEATVVTIPFAHNTNDRMTDSGNAI
jgi:folate-binding protein YgfZ